jgi:hypothetical protein
MLRVCSTVLKRAGRDAVADKSRQRGVGYLLDSFRPSRLTTAFARLGCGSSTVAPSTDYFCSSSPLEAVGASFPASCKKHSRRHGTTREPEEASVATDIVPHNLRRRLRLIRAPRQTSLFSCIDMNPSKARFPVHTATMAPAIMKASKFGAKSGMVRSAGPSRGTK